MRGSGKGMNVSGAAARAAADPHTRSVTHEDDDGEEDAPGDHRADGRLAEALVVEVAYARRIASKVS